MSGRSRPEGQRRREGSDGLQRHVGCSQVRPGWWFRGGPRRRVGRHRRSDREDRDAFALDPRRGRSRQPVLVGVQDRPGLLARQGCGGEEIGPARAGVPVAGRHAVACIVAPDLVGDGHGRGVAGRPCDPSHRCDLCRGPFDGRGQRRFAAEQEDLGGRVPTERVGGARVQGVGGGDQDAAVGQGRPRADGGGVRPVVVAHEDHGVGLVTDRIGHRDGRVDAGCPVEAAHAVPELGHRLFDGCADGRVAAGQVDLRCAAHLAAAGSERPLQLLQHLLTGLRIGAAGGQQQRAEPTDQGGGGEVVDEHVVTTDDRVGGHAVAVRGRAELHRADHRIGIVADPAVLLGVRAAADQRHEQRQGEQRDHRAGA